jgi:hypothetical protein
VIRETRERASIGVCKHLRPAGARWLQRNNRFRAAGGGQAMNSRISFELPCADDCALSAYLFGLCPPTYSESADLFGGVRPCAKISLIPTQLHTLTPLLSSDILSSSTRLCNPPPLPPLHRAHAHAQLHLSGMHSFSRT